MKSSSKGSNVEPSPVFCDFIKDKRKEALWGIEFNHYLVENGSNVFVALGGNHYSIYENTRNGKINILQCFEDPDENEEYYTACWSIVKNPLRSILLTAGKRGIIRICQPNVPNVSETWKHLIGHGHDINQLKISPRQPFLLASASKDKSIRLWNIETYSCIAIFFGERGHRDIVVSIDFHPSGSKLVSGGIDHMIAIWDLTSPQILSTIEKSKMYDEKTSKTAIKSVIEQFPIFTSRSIHLNYIDCVEWFGDHIISKSNCNDVICWVPRLQSGHQTTSKTYTKIVNFGIKNCPWYFMRFAKNKQNSLLALGNADGSVQLWNLQSSQPDESSIYTLKHSARKDVIRDCAFSRCGRDLVFTADNGSIWLYLSNRFQLIPKCYKVYTNKIQSFQILYLMYVHKLKPNNKTYSMNSFDLEYPICKRK